VVPGRRKLVLLAEGLFQAVFPATVNSAPPLAETRFLVEAVMAATTRRPAESGVGRLLDLFARIEARQSTVSASR
jgi:phytoene synthase